jgi:c-di-GMP-binding flagellar brake protein YcgR
MGFSISRLNGKALKDVRNIRQGVMVETELFKGRFKSNVTDIQKKKLL